MKMLLSWILSNRLGQLRYSLIRTYIESVSQLYASVSIVFAILFLISFFSSGVLLMSIGITMLIPTTMEGRGLILLGLGGVIMLLCFVGYLILNSQKMWIKRFRIDGSPS